MGFGPPVPAFLVNVKVEAEDAVLVATVALVTLAEIAEIPYASAAVVEAAGVVVSAPVDTAIE